LAIEILTNLLEKQDILSIDIAIVLLEICGKKISEAHKDILNEVFDNILNFLNNRQLNTEVN